MHACCSNRFNAAIEYTPPPSNKKSAYFCTNEDLPKKYNHILKLLENTTPKHVNYSFKRKVSVVGSEEELTAHVKLFKEAVPKDQTGKFSCFIFDSSCTFLAEMLYGNRKNRNHYQEICFYVGPMNFSESKKRKDSGKKTSGSMSPLHRGFPLKTPKILMLRKRPALLMMNRMNFGKRRT